MGSAEVKYSYTVAFKIKVVKFAEETNLKFQNFLELTEKCCKNDINKRKS